MGLVQAGNQLISNSSVVIGSVKMPGPGTLAIFRADTAGKAKLPPIGFLSLATGEYRDLVVRLTTTPMPGDTLWAVLEKPGTYTESYDGGQSFTVL